MLGSGQVACRQGFFVQMTEVHKSKKKLFKRRETITLMRRSIYEVMRPGSGTMTIFSISRFGHERCHPSIDARINCRRAHCGQTPVKQANKLRRAGERNYISNSHCSTFLMIKPRIPNASTKNRMKVPNLPALDLRARSQMINNIRPMKRVRPQVNPKLEICSSVNRNACYSTAVYVGRPDASTSSR